MDDTPPAVRERVLLRLAAAPARVADVAVSVAGEDEATGGPPAGEWSARENVAHLIAVERAVWQTRLAGLAALSPGEEAAWSWTEPGPVSDPAAATLDGALALFTEERDRTLARLAALGEDGWRRTGVHATYGRLDVTGLLAIAADHDDEHLTTMITGRRR
jgi:DinB superfamily